MVLMDYADSAPATRAPPGCDSAVLPVHNCREISCMDNTEASQCAPAVEERNAFFFYLGSDDPQYPNGGRAGARGVIITIKEDFSRAHFFTLLFPLFFSATKNCHSFANPLLRECFPERSLPVAVTSFLSNLRKLSFYIPGNTE